MVAEDFAQNILAEGVLRDENGIYVYNSSLSSEVELSRSAWEDIYNFDVQELVKDRENFERDKLEDHLRYILPTFKFGRQTIYVEIGCGPSYIGEYIMKTFDSVFVGIDFNYSMLLTLKKYFESKGYSKFILICADVNSMPLLDNSVDFIYGGGVIEHFPDTKHILNEIYRVLKNGGVSYNTVPAISLWWLLRFYNNIPSPQPLRKVFEFVHLSIFKGWILKRFFGYELSFLPHQLEKLHREVGFREICVGTFAVHPSKDKLKNCFLSTVYYKSQTFPLTNALCYTYAQK